MSDSPSDAKAKIIEKLNSATNILVTVSANPSVDQLSACIATTLLLNKYKKNATAVFSGKIPSVLKFLKPADTFQKTTDSLRDFIIALDKSKADKLRYKVEDDVVKIFITPYRTSITEKDLKYSAGDFNVDLILALGVHHQQDLDRAITAHGRIFHDAVTMSINNQPGGDFGVANWEELESSSLSELIATLAADLDGNLMDADIATALLTGIVAETSRFSNEHTHPRTMTISSTLLEAGANQTLVNTQLQDLIGTVVNLAAGTEIKPTADTSREPLHLDDDVADELDIDEMNPLKADSGGKDHAEPAKAADTAAEPKADTADSGEDSKPDAADTDHHDIELPDVAAGSASASAETGKVPDSVPTSIEDLLGTTVESTPAPALDDAQSGSVADSGAGEGAASENSGADRAAEPEDADAARKAVESALGENAAAPDGAQTSAGPVNDSGTPAFDLTSLGLNGNDTSGPTAQPDMSSVQSSPIIQPIDAHQPSYANPATMTEYDAPAAPEHEPAPLGMSPADQAFTMPLPPSSSMPGQAGQQPAPGQQQTGPTPPPLPPTMPPSFG